MRSPAGFSLLYFSVIEIDKPWWFRLTLNLNLSRFISFSIWVRIQFWDSAADLWYGETPNISNKEIIAVTWNLTGWKSEEIVTDRSHRDWWHKRIYFISSRRNSFYCKKNNGISRDIEISVNPSVPDAPNWRISAFEKRLHETETS